MDNDLIDYPIQLNLRLLFIRDNEAIYESLDTGDRYSVAPADHAVQVAYVSPTLKLVSKL